MTRVLLTGASGFVGSRLVPGLLGAGLDVRCLARTPTNLEAATWRNRVEVVRGDVGGDLADAMTGVDVAVYLVHSIGQGTQWTRTERNHATNFARAAAAAGVRRIVYLGGLGRDDDALSEHLRSRHDVGTLLGSTGVEVVEIRAGVIVGGGSASFEMLRKLVECLPVMVTPKWVETKCQPIAISDVVELLVRAVVHADLAPGIYDAGGPDVVTYSQMMATFAQVAGLPRRWLIKVPLLTTRLSSLWVGLVTPLPVPLARELVESLVNEVVVTGPSACEALSVEPLGLRSAMQRAFLASRVRTNAETSEANGDRDAFYPLATDPTWSGATVLSDRRSAHSSVSPRVVFAALESLGGATGWYGARWLWWFRGLLDQAVGGPGLRRGRTASLAEGDPLDFWRIEVLDAPRCMRLRAEMRLPGRAWLTWTLEEAAGGTQIVQEATFEPHGFLGRAYWYAVSPFHVYVFPQLLRGIVASAKRLEHQTS